ANLSAVSRLSGASVLRALVVAAVLFVALPDTALAADAVTLRASASPVSYGGRVTFSGAITPAVAGENVGIYAQAGDTWTPVGTATADSEGVFSLSLTMRAPGVFFARGADSAGNPVDSEIGRAHV